MLFVKRKALFPGFPEKKGNPKVPLLFLFAKRKTKSRPFQGGKLMLRVSIGNVFSCFYKNIKRRAFSVGQTEKARQAKERSWLF